MAKVSLLIEDCDNGTDTGVRAFIDTDGAKEGTPTNAEKIALCLMELLPIINNILVRENVSTLVEMGVEIPDRYLMKEE